MCSSSSQQLVRVSVHQITWTYQLTLTIYKVSFENKSSNLGEIIVSMGSPHPPEANSQRREIGDLAVWTLSSAKPGNGVE